jgi:hypothetical protein
VDDQPANLLALEVVLEPLGHEVVRARSGTEALRALLRRDFTLIVMDVHMPGLDGIETVEIIKTSDRHRHIPILFVTAMCKDTDHVFRAYATGAVDYVMKPYDEKILRMKVSALIDVALQREMIRRQAELIRRHEREAMERKAEFRFRTLVDAMPLCVWTAHTDGRFDYANRAAVEHTGAVAGEEIGATLFRSLHADDRRATLLAWTTALGDRAPMEAQARLSWRGGGYRWHVIRAVPLREEEHRITGWLVTAADIDDQKRAEEAERRRRADAETANSSAMKNEFLTTVSHELRTPLTTIVWNAQLLQKGTLSPERAAQAAERIARSAAAQTRLIDNMLDVSQIAAGRLEIQIERVDAVASIEETLDALRATAQLKHVSLAADIEPRKALLMADPRRLRQILWEVILNGIKFTPAGGRVDVRARHAGAMFEITVSDTGKGISAAFLPDVFRCFSKASDTGVGLGVGLSLVHKLVELHGGSIRAESEGEGRGATITIHLPHARQRRVRAEHGRRGVRRFSPASLGLLASCPAGSRRRMTT